MNDEHQHHHKHVKLSCRTLEDIKVPLHLDGDTSLFIRNCIAYTTETLDDHMLMALGAHEHTVPKVERLMEDIDERIDPDKWVEK